MVPFEFEQIVVELDVIVLSDGLEHPTVWYVELNELSQPVPVNVT